MQHSRARRWQAFQDAVGRTLADVLGPNGLIYYYTELSLYLIILFYICISDVTDIIIFFLPQL